MFSFWSINIELHSKFLELLGQEIAQAFYFFLVFFIIFPSFLFGIIIEGFFSEFIIRFSGFLSKKEDILLIRVESSIEFNFFEVMI